MFDDADYYAFTIDAVISAPPRSVRSDEARFAR